MNSRVVGINVIWVLVIFAMSVTSWPLSNGCLSLVTSQIVWGKFWLYSIVGFWQILSRCRHLSNLWLTELWITVNFILHVLICVSTFLCSTFARIYGCQWFNLFRFPRCLDCLRGFVGVSRILLFLGQTLDTPVVISLNLSPSLPTALLWRHILIWRHIRVGQAESLRLVALNLNFIVAVHLDSFSSPMIPRYNLSYFTIVGLATFSMDTTQSWTSRRFYH